MPKRRLILAALAGLLCLAAIRLRGNGRRPARAAWPVNVGHRGSPLRFPENTLASYRAAVESGAGALELDVHLTRDGHPVVMHDPIVDRTTDGSGPIAAKTLREIQGLNAGFRGADTNGRFAVPTLAEVLEEFPAAAVNVDIKERERPGAEAAVLDVLREAGARGRALVASSRHAVVRRFRGLAGGEVDTGASRFEIGVFLLLSSLRLERLARPAYAALQVPVWYGPLPIVTPRFVEAAHRCGVRVDVWTIDEPGQMRSLLDLGVDAVITDRPEVLEGVLVERGQAVRTSATETTPKRA